MDAGFRAFCALAWLCLVGDEGALDLVGVEGLGFLAIGFGDVVLGCVWFDP
jgi:hypothetical protein